MKNLTLGLIITVLLAASNAYSQEKTDAKGDIRQVPSMQNNTRDLIQFNIALDFKQREPDNRGTDVTNIYNITVSVVQENEYTKSFTNQYTIVYYIDDRMIEAMNGPLPFSFERNFKGLLPGSHQIKVEIEDGNNHVLARATHTLEVRPTR